VADCRKCFPGNIKNGTGVSILLRVLFAGKIKSIKNKIGMQICPEDNQQYEKSDK